MFKSITKVVVALMICALAFPVSAYAHEWEDLTYDSNNDEATHTHRYICYDCGEEYSSVEPCTWNHSHYEVVNYGQDGHYNVYDCPLCYGTKKVRENCSWKKNDSLYSDWSSSKHEVTTYYDCTTCQNQKKVVKYKKHVFKWVRHGSSFWFECKYCSNMPKYNGNVLMDYNDTDNVSIRKGKTYKYRMGWYNKAHNKVKSIKRSKKKVCTAKRNGSKIVIKGKKKGKCKVTVKMSSGAKYVIKVRVK